MTDPINTDGGSDDVTDAQETRVTYEIGEDEQPSEAVVRATAACTNKSVLDLDPLYNVVDPDHLDGLFCGGGLGPGRDEMSVTFNFIGCRISVTGENIVVDAPDDVVD